MSPRARAPLPGSIRSTSFRTDDVGFHGLTRGRLAGSDLQRPFAGVRSVALDLESMRGRCIAYEPLLRPGEAFSHTSAAALYGLPLPVAAERGRLHVSSPPGVARARSRGVVGHEHSRPLPKQPVHGLPVVPVVLAWCQLGALLDLHDLVACGDAIVSSPRMRAGRRARLGTVDDLRAAIVEWGRRPGAGALRRAVESVRPGVDSRPESLLRLLILEAGLEEPAIGPPIVLRDGRVLHPDLAWLRARVAFEYEGDRHRTDARRWRSDIRRREDLEDAGWRVVRVTWDDLTTDRAAFGARIRRLVGARELAGPG